MFSTVIFFNINAVETFSLLAHIAISFFFPLLFIYFFMSEYFVSASVVIFYFVTKTIKIKDTKFIWSRCWMDQSKHMSSNRIFKSKI